MSENKGKDIRKRFVKFRVNDDEYEAIERKFRVSGLSSKSEFLRLMIFRGIIVRFRENDIKEFHRLLKNISNNINQIAVRANSTGKIYADDINEIKKNQEKIWQQQKSFLSKIQKAKP